MSTRSDEANGLVEALAAIAFSVMGVLTKVAAEHDLSLTQLRMIGILRDRQLTITELAHALGLDRSSVSGLVDRTERRGLLVRTPNPDDARSIRVSLSAAGVDALAVGTSETGGLLSELTDGLSQRERERLTQLLDRMIEHRGL